MPLFGNIFKGTDNPEPDFSFLGTDMHSHLIPGVDDGSPDVATSISLIKELKKRGYKKLITTPHIFLDYYPNNSVTLNIGYEKLQLGMQKAGMDFPVRVAAEYYLDTHVMDLLEEGIPLLALSGNKVLVEFSMVTPPMHRDELLFRLRIKGYEPVIAHPERYTYYHQDFDQYEYLVDQGFALQLNILSFSGQYGKRVQKTAHQLMDKKLVQYLGTDLHHARHAARLEDLQENKKLMKKLAAYPWKNPGL